LFLIGEEHLIAWCKREVTYEFEIKDLGLVHYFLILEFWQSKDGIFLSQGKYTIDVLRCFGMMDCKSMTTQMVSNLRKLPESDSGLGLVDPTLYRHLIGSLVYFIYLKLDICDDVSSLSQFMSYLRNNHWVVAKHVLRYL